MRGSRPAVGFGAVPGFEVAVEAYAAVVGLMCDVAHPGSAKRISSAPLVQTTGAPG